MKTLLLVALTVALGVALGVGAAILRIGAAPWDRRLDQGVESPAAVELPPGTPAPKVFVGQTEFNFGTLDMQGEGSHDFVFRNEGDAPLVLSEGGTSCRCTMSKLGLESIPPDGSAKVTVSWKPTDKPGPYRQTAKILTNDPLQPQVTLTVSGQITVATRLSPPELVFTRLAAGETSTGQVQLFCYLDEPLKILDRKWSEAATAEYFDATLRPLSAEELKADPAARSGMLVAVTVRPGLPQGSIRQKLMLKTNLTSPAALTLPIEGAVGSEIAVVGRGWDPDTGILTLGEVHRGAGIQRRMMLVVRGPSRKQVEFKTVRVEPSVLAVSFGPPSEINKGAVVQTPLSIGIPPGSPPANHLGSEQGPLGEIILQTTHPQVPKLRILVRFVIEG